MQRPVAYLRAAQAYMLISMPTGTSTILGAFQAILALLCWSTGLFGQLGSVVKGSTLIHKVTRSKNFASEIFTLCRS
jgi:hypothetical protein